MSVCPWLTTSPNPEKLDVLCCKGGFAMASSSDLCAYPTRQDLRATCALRKRIAVSMLPDIAETVDDLERWVKRARSGSSCDGSLDAQPHIASIHRISEPGATP